MINSHHSLDLHFTSNVTSLKKKHFWIAIVEKSDVAEKKQSDILLNIFMNIPITDIIYSFVCCICMAYEI